jgi:hypothetical protein
MAFQPSKIYWPPKRQNASNQPVRNPAVSLRPLELEIRLFT